MNINLCCRACLDDKDLNSILTDTKLQEQYSILTGNFLDLNDEYPKVLCTKCIDFINKSIKFRKNCYRSLKILSNRLSRGVTDSEVLCDLQTKDTFTIINIESISNNIKLEIDQQHDDVKINNDKNDENRCAEIKTVIENILLKQRKEVKGRNIKKVKSKISRPPTIECEICKKMVRRQRYKAHKKIHGVRPFICQHCASGFMSELKLLSHCKSKHGYEKTDKCRFCEYLGASSENVKLHERIHTGEKPYCCKVCGATFYRLSGYNQHMPIHLSKKTIKCDICSMMFKSVAHMRVHRDRIHKPSKYIYKCGICNKVFARRCNVTKHLKKLHNYADSEEQKPVERLLKNDLVL